MEDDYYSTEAILAENQKIQCTFKKEIPNMGHLAGGNERDVRTRYNYVAVFSRVVADKTWDESPSTDMASTHSVLLVSCHIRPSYINLEPVVADMQT